MAKQTTITIEIESLLILRSRSSRAVWCPVCGIEAEMIALGDTSVMSKFDQTAFQQWLNSGNLHRAEAPDGSSLICLNSLLARMQNSKPADCGTPQRPHVNKERT